MKNSVVDGVDFSDLAALTKHLEEKYSKADTTENDAVNHPSHYTSGKIEVIDYIEDTLTDDEFYGYIIGNVLKYISRAKHKHETPLEDLEKARWYLNRLIEALEKKNG